MTPTTEILISSPLSGSEAAALRDLVSSLSGPALILANFEISRAGTAREIDFVVVTETRAELIELKNITAPVKGGVNGPWQIETSPGSFVPYSGPNPWEQARDAKLALSDAMHDYAKKRSGVPGPAKRRYYEQFDASVTVYPMIMPGSQVSAGNYKAWIRSFPETLQCLNSRPLPVQTTWMISDWRQFAIDYLGLVTATLSEAIDAAVFRAHESVAAYAAKLQHPAIAALLDHRDQELVGQNIIERLRGPSDMLLLGRSGLGKSFHLEHYRRKCFDFDELPILLHGRYYQGDLDKGICKNIGPYTPLTPAALLEVAAKLGRRLVLIVDGWNECPVQLQSDLGNDLRAFQLRYNARLIIASQTVLSHELFATMVAVEIDPLRDEHKQAIFGFHSGTQNDSIPVHFYQQFSTAFDITVAARCQTGGTVANTRAELYDSYVRSTVPSISARAVVRKLAHYMGENLKPVLSLCDFEHIVEQLVREMGLSLSIADELLHCRLFEVDRETVTFEHELLREYFRAEQLLEAPEQIPAQLARPKCAGLMEFVIPSLRDENLVRELLSHSGTQLLNDALRGSLGSVAKNLILEECLQVMAGCRDRLSEVRVESVVGVYDDGRKFVSTAHVADNTCASDREREICTVVASNLDDDLLREAFLELLDLGEWTLKNASECAGRANGVKGRAIFRQLMHDNVIQCHSNPVHPVLFLCHQIRQGWPVGSQRLGDSLFHEILLRKAHGATCGTLGLLILMELPCSGSNGFADVITIARQAWNNGFQMEALHFIFCNARAIRDAGAQSERAVIDLLESFDPSGSIILSTEWLTIRSLFSGYQSPIDVESARKEFRQILAPAEEEDDSLFQLERQSKPMLTFAEFVSNRASHALGMMFEYAVQSAYSEAYESLRDEEKKKLLILSLRGERGLFVNSSWYLEPLSKLGFDGAEDILTRYGGRIDPESHCPQDDVACFVIANEAWAQIADEPLPYQDCSSTDHRVWAVLGELLFWLKRKDEDSSERILVLCRELKGYPEALPDALMQLERSDYMHLRPTSALQPLLAAQPEAVRDALHATLQSARQLTSVFRGPIQPVELVQWTISTLGKIGDGKTVSLLRAWTENAVCGRDAIHAIEQIEHRLALHA